MHAKLLAALILVESNGDPAAVGDGGRAIGALQITAACVRDVNRYSGSTYRWPQDCRDMDKSRRIAAIYLTEYGTRRGKLTARDLALIWNRGPRGARRGDPGGYWLKVQRELAQLNRN